MLRALITLLLPLCLMADVTKKIIPGDYTADKTGLQNAADYCRTLNSTDPCIVEIAAGTTITITTPVTLAAQQNATKWIIFRSSKIGELPDGQRVTASDVSKMATIQNTGSSQLGVFVIPPDITGVIGTAVPSHYRFEGLELYYSGSGASYGGTVSMGVGTDGASQAKQLWQNPKNIVIDRCWMHGMPFATWVVGGTTHALVNGTRADAANVTIKNSFIHDLHMDTADFGTAETHGIHATNTQGPLYIYNNRLEGAIGSLTGGSGANIRGVIALGTYYFANEYTRDPNIWHWQDFASPGPNVGDPCQIGAYYDERFGSNLKKDCLAGTWQITATTRAKRDWEKNGWECKSCRIAVVEGNYVHDIPTVGDQSQPGHAYLINLVDYTIGIPWARPEYIKMRYNRARRTGQGFITSTLGGNEGTSYYRRINHLSLESNVIENMINPTVVPTGAPQPGGTAIDVTDVDGMTIRHNTIMKYGSTGGTPLRTTGALTPGNKDIVVKDNIIFWGGNGFFRNGTALGSDQGCAAMINFWNGTRDLRNNVIVDTNSQGGPAGWWTTYYGAASGCISSAYAATWASVGFTSFADENGTYSLTGASSLHNTASDGTDPGVDWAQYNFAQSGVSTGTPDFKWWEFKIRRAEKAEIRYTAYDSTACTVTVKNAAGSTVFTQTDAGGTNLDRSVDPSGSLGTPGVYTGRVTCAGGRYREEEMRVW